MFWLARALTLLAGITVMAVILGKRPVRGLGSVSEHWIAQHRADWP